MLTTNSNNKMASITLIKKGNKQWMNWKCHLKLLRLKKNTHHDVTSYVMFRTAGAHSSAILFFIGSGSAVGGNRRSNPASASEGCIFITKPYTSTSLSSIKKHA
jgi:hypothetical protein